jgi:4-aminobutyrate aminotransferase / (S)-3-amino-2-methylpropionate transaminase / 5-aminovalerate transaminase
MSARTDNSGGQEKMKVNNKSLGELRSTVMAKGFASGKPIYIASAKGAMLYDVEGNEYIDFGGGIAVMNVGHSNPKVIKAIQDRSEEHTSELQSL